MKEILKAKRNTKNSKGITLIALVVTIIVLLILAGVSVTTLIGNNGILTQAQNAKKETEKSGTKEQVKIAVIGSMATEKGEINKTALQKELEELGAEIETEDGNINNIPVIIKIGQEEYQITEDGDVLTGANIENIADKFLTGTTIVRDSENNQFVVPSGFKVVASEAKKVTEGIVIEGKTGNQYVWIPCTNDGVNGTLKYQRTRWGVEADNGTDAIKDELTLLDSDVKYIASDTNNDITADVSKEIVNQINAEKESIAKYKGYYIGRYETGKLADKTAVIKYNQTPYTDIKWYNAYKMAKEIDVGSSATSYLCSSYSWDTAINFIQNNTSYKNYAESRDKTNENWSDMEVKNGETVIKPSGTAKRLETGKTTAKANIFDMGGNVAEYTTEINPGTSESVVLRGGPCGTINLPAGHRWDDIAGLSYSYGGFRATLFIK